MLRMSCNASALVAVSFSIEVKARLYEKSKENELGLLTTL